MPIWRRKLRRIRSGLPKPVSWATASIEPPPPSSRRRAASTRARSTNRAGLTPIVTAAGLDLAGLLGGAIILETIFSLPGLGSLAVSAVLDPDLAILVGVTLLTAVFIIIANLVVDLLYAVIDPRVRLS